MCADGVKLHRRTEKSVKAQRERTCATVTVTATVGMAKKTITEGQGTH